MTPQTIIAHKPHFYRRRRLLQGFTPLHQTCFYFKYWLSAFFQCLNLNSSFHPFAVPTDRWAVFFFCCNLSVSVLEFDKIPSVSNSWAASMGNIHQDSGYKTIQQQDKTSRQDDKNNYCNLHPSIIHELVLLQIQKDSYVIYKRCIDRKSLVTDPQGGMLCVGKSFC